MPEVRSYAPISQAEPCGRGTPRWSAVTGLPEKSLQSLAASMATLPGKRAWVAVVPGGLRARGPRLSCMGVTWVKPGQVPSVARLAPETTTLAQFKQLPPVGLLATIALFTFRIPRIAPRGWRNF